MTKVNRRKSQSKFIRFVIPRNVATRNLQWGSSRFLTAEGGPGMTNLESRLLISLSEPRHRLSDGIIAHRIHQPDPQRFARVSLSRSHKHFQRLCFSNQPGKPLRPTPSSDQSQGGSTMSEDGGWSWQSSDDMPQPGQVYRPCSNLKSLRKPGQGSTRLYSSDSDPSGRTHNPPAR